ncbi:hypothetical protein IP88_10230, partial [alpha proteobacterium AAP81b]
QDAAGAADAPAAAAGGAPAAAPGNAASSVVPPPKPKPPSADAAPVAPPAAATAGGAPASAEKTIVLPPEEPPPARAAPPALPETNLPDRLDATATADPTPPQKPGAGTDWAPIAIGIVVIGLIVGILFAARKLLRPAPLPAASGLSPPRDDVAELTRNRLDRLERSLGGLERLIEDLQRGQLNIERRLAAMQSTAPAPVHAPAWPAAAAAPPPAAATGGLWRQDVAPPQPSPFPAPSPAPWPGPVPPPPAPRAAPVPVQRGRPAWLPRFRAILEHPAIQDYSEWATAVQARGVRLESDGQVYPEGDATSTILAMVTDEQGRWLIPGGELVAEFATRYQEALTLRRHVEAAFDLDTDGGGLLKLVEPAQLDSADAGGRIAVKGRLGGLRG